MKKPEVKKAVGKSPASKMSESVKKNSPAEKMKKPAVAIAVVAKKKKK